MVGGVTNLSAGLLGAYDAASGIGKFGLHHSFLILTTIQVSHVFPCTSNDHTALRHLNFFKDLCPLQPIPTPVGIFTHTRTRIRGPGIS